MNEKYAELMPEFVWGVVIDEAELNLRVARQVLEVKSNISKDLRDMLVKSQHDLADILKDIPAYCGAYRDARQLDKDIYDLLESVS